MIKPKPDSLALRAKALAEELGAEGIVIVTMLPNEDGTGWIAHNAAFMNSDHGLEWELMATSTYHAAEDLLKVEPIEVDRPS